MWYVKNFLGIQKAWVRFPALWKSGLEPNAYNLSILQIETGDYYEVQGHSYLHEEFRASLS